MLDVMLHLAFITYVNLGERIHENRWVLFDARFDINDELVNKLKYAKNMHW
jgi:hypothetical protein